ncbi:ABC transporter ATP-binding protein [Meiothermus sp.]|uniref:ABC transporter ATP-binding protein n=1 Tax=Meiothermus sp. TaxID=1955249 RepID=UPI0021DD0EFC|nr:ABC transporter ATP-binding protein [Meiothermus sp.]GIW35177.1 MAG: ABC transporter ATP-binding protein [Meiothermus sp.]
MPEALVEVRGARRSYGLGGGETVALERATCRVLPGDRIALLGPSGSGKSTLLHLMGGLERPTSGSVRFPALGEPDELRPGKVAFVFQAQSLLAPLTALENAALPLVLGGVEEREAEIRAMEALERLGLEKVAQQLPEELSGGQAQRVAVARALAGSPRLILADEPTGQLDSETGAQLMDTLLGALENTETALVVATHDLGVARRMDWVWQMRRGVLDTGKGVPA